MAPKITTNKPKLNSSGNDSLGFFLHFNASATTLGGDTLLEVSSSLQLCSGAYTIIPYRLLPLVLGQEDIGYPLRSFFFRIYKTLCKSSNSPLTFLLL